MENTDGKMERTLIRNFTVSGEQESIEQLISDLKFIAKIRAGERIDVKNRKIIGADVPSRMYRTMVSRETREETYEFIHSRTTKAIDKIYYYRDLDDPFYVDVAKIITDNLLATKEGIEGLVNTYEGDKKFVARLEALIEMQDAKISQKNKFT